MHHKFWSRKSSSFHSRDQIKINSGQAMTLLFELVRTSRKCSDKVAGQFYLDVGMASTEENLFLFAL